MANQEHLDILKQGVEVWNKWRRKYSGIQPGLSNSNLSAIERALEIILIDANLSGVNLMGTNLQGANLSRADLSHANLDGVLLSGANLNNANLSEAHLMATNLVGADLSHANLSKSMIVGTYFRNTNLNGTDFSQAMMLLTVFAEVDLSVAEGLDAIDHKGPSTIGIDTIYESKGNIPEAFLKGAGVDDTFITHIRSLIGKPIEYYSCFISYSSKDEAFAKRLYADLQARGVRCWYAPEDMKTGDVIRSRIDEAIRVHDKLLLVLSQHSVDSSWVEKEVETAFEKERQQKRHVLFPVRLDVANCWPRNKPSPIRSRNPPIVPRCAGFFHVLRALISCTSA